MMYTSRENLQEVTYCPMCNYYWVFCSRGHFNYTNDSEFRKGEEFVRCDCGEYMLVNFNLKERRCPGCTLWHSIPKKEWVVDED